MSLTDPIATIVSILSNGSTGLNTSGYEIYKDNDSTLTTLLITYPMSKEKLVALFGGSQDYDVIIVVSSGEGSSEWIGLSTQAHTIPVELIAHVIEKHTTTGSGQKVISPEQVVWKAFDVLSRFIDVHVSSPGGSILTWTQGTHRFELDKTVRPIMHKCVIQTSCRVIR